MTKVEVIDSAYWVKGCGSLGRLCYVVLPGVADKRSETTDSCLMDIKEAVDSVAPAFPGAPKLEGNAERAVSGARHISPYLRGRMRATYLGNWPISIRELRPQDLKVEIGQRTTRQQ